MKNEENGLSLNAETRYQISSIGRRYTLSVGKERTERCCPVILPDAYRAGAATS
jgi:hypothetical protein